MYTFFSIMVIICAILLTLIVLIQNSKGGGLASNFGQGNQVMGVKKTTDFLEKATWTLAAALIVFCLLSSFTVKNAEKPSANSMMTTTTATVPPSQQ